jgi:hypothetical protein
MTAGTLPKRERQRLTRIWLTRLAAMVAGGKDPVADVKQRISDYAKTLPDNFQDDLCFTDAALTAMAQKFKFFPAFAELHEALTEYYHANKPKPKLKPSEQRGLTGETALWLDYWHKRKDEIARGMINPNASMPRYHSKTEALENLASLVRKQSPEAWAVIAEGDGYEQR